MKVVEINKIVNFKILIRFLHKALNKRIYGSFIKRQGLQHIYLLCVPDHFTMLSDRQAFLKNYCVENHTKNF